MDLIWPQSSNLSIFYILFTHFSVTKFNFWTKLYIPTWFLKESIFQASEALHIVSFENVCALLIVIKSYTWFFLPKQNHWWRGRNYLLTHISTGPHISQIIITILVFLKFMSICSRSCTKCLVSWLNSNFTWWKF